MKYKRLLILGLALLLVLFSFGCKLNKKAQTYTTTLEGISIHVPSLTGGIINKLMVDEGRWINVGDTLAILDSREIRYQADQIDASLTELSIQTQIANSNLQQAQTDLAYIQEKQQRTQRLLTSEVIQQQSLDDLNNLLQKSRTMVNNANDQLTMLRATQEKLLAQKKILLKKIADAVIISPAKGKITSLYYRQGEALAPYANLLEVINTASLQAKIYVSESELAKVKTGQQVKVITESGQKYPAVIDHISNQAEFTPKTILTPDTRASMVYAVTLKVENPKDTLKDGMPVDVEL